MQVTKFDAIYVFYVYPWQSSFITRKTSAHIVSTQAPYLCKFGQHKCITWFKQSNWIAFSRFSMYSCFGFPFFFLLSLDFIISCKYFWFSRFTGSTTSNKFNYNVWFKCKHKYSKSRSIFWSIWNVYNTFTVSIKPFFFMPIFWLSFFYCRCPNRNIAFNYINFDKSECNWILSKAIYLFCFSKKVFHSLDEAREG